MTSNAGASDLAKPPMGFNRSKREGDDTDAINKLFTPEFRNRLDAIIPFSGLPEDVISKVVDKFVFQLEAQLADRGVMIELSPEASKWIAERGYDEKFGARPLSRVIQEHIKKPLADELLFGKLLKGGTVKVVVEGTPPDDKLGFEFIALDAKPEEPPSDADDSADGSDTGKKPKALVDAGGSRKALPGPKGGRGKGKGSRSGSKSGSVPRVPRKKTDDE